MTQELVDLLGAEGFRSGLLLGLLAGALLVLMRSARQQLVPWAGVAAVLATLLGLDAKAHTPGWVVLALTLLGVGGYVSRGTHPVVRVTAALPGAVVLATATDVPGAQWVPSAVLVVASLGAMLVADFDDAAARSGLAPVLVGVTSVGIYLSGPDTEQSIVLVGVTLPIALLGWPVPTASLGAAGAYAMTGLVTWVAVTAGSARPGAIVGGMACLGVLVVEPAGRRLVGVNGIASGRAYVPRLVTIAAVHVALVGACSRVAGLRASATDALLIAAVVLAAAAVVLAGLGLVTKRAAR